MARFTPQFLDTLRNRVTLSAQVGQHVKLTRAGREFRACCPFHEEKTPSFYVNDEKGFYHCFGCGAHGDVIGFLMQVTGQDFMTIVQELATSAGLEIPVSRQDSQTNYRHGDLHKILDVAASFFEDCLTRDAGRPARAYMDERTIRDKMRKDFRLGYAPADDSLITFLRKQGIDEERQVLAGLAKPSTRGQGYYSFFRDRLMFPICDVRGRVLGFGGRTLTGQEPKYINSPETPVFSKGQQLYGMHVFDRSVREPIIVVEGYMDVIAAKSQGFARVLAPLGTALTPHHLSSLWRYGHADEQDLNAPIACFDGDTAGVRAARRLAGTALAQLEPGRSVRFALLPKGEDPDSLLSQAGGRDALGQVLNQATDLVDFIWTDAIRNGVPRTPETRAKLRQNLSHQADLIPDRTIKELYSADLMGRFFQACKQESRPSRSPDSSVVVKKPTPWPDQRYVVLLSMLMNVPSLWRAFEDNLDAIEWYDTYARSIFHLAAQVMDGAPEIDSQELHERIVALDPSLERALHRLRDIFTKHGGPIESYADTFAEGLRNTQQERLRNDYRDTMLRFEAQGRQSDEKRMAYLVAELDKLVNSQGYMVTGYVRRFTMTPAWAGGSKAYSEFSRDSSSDSSSGSSSNGSPEKSVPAVRISGRSVA